MAKKKEDKKSTKNQKGEREDREKKGAKNGVYAILSFIVALFFIFSAFGSAGVAGGFIYTTFKTLFGAGYIFVPIVGILLGVSFIRTEGPAVGLRHSLSALGFFLSILALFHIASPVNGGGVIGKAISIPFVALFDKAFSVLILIAASVSSILILFDAEIPLMQFFQLLSSKGDKKKERIADDAEAVRSLPVNGVAEEKKGEKSQPATEKKPAKISTGEEVFDIGPKGKKQFFGDYTPPPIEILATESGKPGVGDIRENAAIIRRTLATFGILVEMDEITVGPTVTRYALKPAEGVKLSRIVALQNDLALALAASSIRVEAPIPGKSLVGIEIPNKTKATVGLATILESDEYRASGKPLLVALGRSVANRPVLGNLAKMPHLLIAGTTGSGKSVTIHSIISSLLYRLGPEDLRFILIDPKRVELTLYNKIPHLLTPVITDAKKAILSLKWAAQEMNRRYDILEKESVRDIDSYHTRFKGSKDDNQERMPFIVIVIDELADIMSTYPRELESAIVRLAQMSRAVGIHLILSTQRPSVNVITGLIKANVPARIALQVSSQIDSRTILDASGAEKLVGAGDMLYQSSSSPHPERLQSAFITEGEVKDVVKYLADRYKDDLPSDITIGAGSISADKNIFESSGLGDEADDDMYEEAKQTVIEAGKASTSFLQRRLSLGYARAARIMDMLEKNGVIGPGVGAKPREVLMRPHNPAEDEHILDKDTPANTEAEEKDE